VTGVRGTGGIAAFGTAVLASTLVGAEVLAAILRPFFERRFDFAGAGAASACVPSSAACACPSAGLPASAAPSSAAAAFFGALAFFLPLDFEAFGAVPPPPGA